MSSRNVSKESLRKFDLSQYTCGVWKHHGDRAALPAVSGGRQEFTVAQLFAPSLYCFRHPAEHTGLTTVHLAASRIAFHSQIFSSVPQLVNLSWSPCKCCFAFLQNLLNSSLACLLQKKPNPRSNTHVVFLLITVTCSWAKIGKYKEVA